MTDRAIRRMIVLVASVAIVTAALGLWLWVRDRPQLTMDHRLREQIEVLESKIAEAEQRVVTVSALIPAEQEKVVKTENIIRQLESTQSTWDLFIGQRAQQRANNERLASMRALNASTVAKVADLQQQVARAKWDRDMHQIERTRIESQLRVLEAEQASPAYKLRQIWLTVRAWLCFGSSLFLVGAVMIPLVLEQRRRTKGGVTVGAGPA